MWGLVGHVKNFTFTPKEMGKDWKAQIEDL